jgi:hypothetical protein
MQFRLIYEVNTKELGDDDYVLFDCPGQIELFTHLNLMNELT